MIVPDLIKAVEAGQEKARLEIQSKYHMNNEITEAKQEISNYLASGGLFNPELANHTEVRDLLIELRTLLDRIESRL